MIPDLPDLQFLKIDSLVMHEHHDHQRTAPLVERIRESGVFRNPPVVMPLEDGSGHYMILDGANRVTALQQMGFPDILVQVVSVSSPGLQLQNWNHVLWERTPREVMVGIRELDGINLLPTEACDVAAPDLWGDCGLALLQIPDGRIYTVCTDARELVHRVELLNGIVDSYRRSCRLDRVGARCIDDMCDLYPDLSALVIFPQFDIQEVKTLASDGYLLPSGITRFTVSPRALHINYPLYELAAQKPVEEKNAALKDWLARKVAKKGIRYYAEATFLYDE
jgi:hypothetical protein